MGYLKKTLSVICALALVILAAPGAVQSASAEGWGSRLTLPSAADVLSYKTNDRSPYIVCWPEFAGCDAYTEYAVDFRAEFLPRGTYLSVCSWNMDLSSLKRSYASVTRDADWVAAYAGFQVLGDGRHVAIMSVWDTFCRDRNGTVQTIRAKVTYPNEGKPFDGEGTGMQCIIPFDWKEGRSYRALIQQSESARGTAVLTFWVCDLADQRWTKLIEYDLNIADTHMTGACAFLENFIPSYAANLRTMELWNFKVRSKRTGKWVAGRKASMYECFELPGSYNYGASGDRFWAVTTALPNRCRKPAQYKECSVTRCDTGEPY